MWNKDLGSLTSGTTQHQLRKTQFSAFSNTNRPKSDKLSVTFCDLSEELVNVEPSDLSVCDGNICLIGRLIDSATGNHVLIHINHFDKQLSKISAEDGCFILLSKSSVFPHLLITASYISALVFTNQPEGLVNKLMQFDSAATADSLCCINCWDRCSIPIHALEDGLKHRQLDTVAFFLKSKENAFLQAAAPAAAPAAAAGDETDLKSISQMDIAQFDTAIKLLISNIQEFINEHQSKQFAEQLLQITLTHLHKILQNLIMRKNRQNIKHRTSFQNIETVKCDEYENQEETQLIIKVSRYILYLRNELKPTSITRRRRAEAVYNESERNSSNEELSSYDCMSVQEAVEDGLISGSLASVQGFLCKTYGVEIGSLNAILNIGLQTVLIHLKDHNIQTASKLLKNMGFEVNEKLKDICLMTTDRRLREYLITILSDEVLTDEMKSMIRYLHEIETIYSCQSFDEVLSQILQLVQTDCSDVERILNSIVEGEGRHLPVGEIEPSADVDNCESPSYSHYVLSWLRDLDENTIQLILLDKLITTRDTCFCEKINSEIIWTYLVKHNRKDELLKWIRKQFPLKCEPLIGGEHEVGGWPYNRLITQQMIDTIDSCTDYIKQILLTELARRGMFCSEEFNDFRLMLNRCCKIDDVFSMEFINNFAHNRSNLKIDSFYDHLIDSLITNQQAAVLYQVTDQQNNYLRSIASTRRSVSSSVEMMLNFQELSHNSQDKSLICKASLSNGRFVYDTETINEMLDAGRVLAVVATLQYCQVPFDQLMSGIQDEVIGHLNVQSIHQYLKQYPKLYSAISPASSTPSSSLSSSVTQDITVYQLLQGNAPFEPSRLFGWQKYNSTLAEGEKDIMKLMPNFSRFDLQSQYGYTESLQASYFLLHGRASFAFLTFVMSQLETGVSQIPQSKINIACKKAKHLAVKNFNKPMISGACVAFIKMLGRDTVLTRVYLTAANTIHSRRTSWMTAGTIDKRREAEREQESKTIQLIVSCMKNQRKFAGSVLEEFEKAIQWSIEKDNVKCDSTEMILRWQPVLLFCRYHKLPLSSVPLEVCAKDDNWLSFMLFSHLHQYEKEQLEGILHHFPSKQLQEHLFYTLENVGVVTTPGGGGAAGGAAVRGGRIPAAAAAAGRVKKDRDVRASLYSRVGVSRKKSKTNQGATDGNSSTDSSEEEDDDTTTSSAFESNTQNPEIPQTKPIKVESVDDNLFSVLFSCQATHCPWRSLLAHSIAHKNCVFAVLAACYKDHDSLSCVCCWLVSSATDAVTDEIRTHFVSLENVAWSSDDLILIVTLLIDNRQVQTILEAFQIFKYNVVLCSLFGFMHTSIRRDWTAAQKHLENFKNTMEKMRSKQVKNELMIDVNETESMTLTFLKRFLIGFESMFDITRILNTIHKSAFTRSINRTVPMFHKLWQMYVIAENCDCFLDPALFIYPEDEDSFNHSCEEALNEMMDKKNYVEAHEFAQLIAFPRTEITIKQLTDELKDMRLLEIWKSEQARIMFWKNCSKILTEHSADAEPAATFFLGASATLIDTCHEKLVTLELAYDWLNKVDNVDATLRDKLDSLQLEIWQNKLKAEEKLILDQTERRRSIPDRLEMFVSEKTEPKNKVEKQELLQYGKMPRDVEYTDERYTNSEMAALDSLFGKLLNSGKISEAGHLAAELKYYNQDLAIVLTIIRLAQGAILPENIDSSVRNLLTKTPPSDAVRRRRLSITVINPPTTGLTRSNSMMKSINDEATGAVSADSSVASASEYFARDAQEVIDTIESLSEYCIKGNQVCSMVITVYKIAQVLNRSYESAMKEDEFILLEALLVCQHPDRFRLARNYIVSTGLPDNQVAGYLVDAILHSLSVITGASTTNTASAQSVNELIYNPMEDRTLFTELMRMCTDSTILGNRLLDAASTYTTNPTSNTGCLSMEVELLVHAHECYTLACNMEGIARVLREARRCTDCLAAAEEFTLIIRLLTGVARFSEMTYVFDLLQQNHQFELLFRKGMEKESKLRLAVLDYLKRSHQTDSDMYTMVSLHFTMYREIAQTLEEAALQQLKQFKKKNIEMNSENQMILQNIQQYYCDAAESYVKEDCLRHAQRCLKQARLVALQLKLLSNGNKTQLLHMSDLNLAGFIATHTNFWESYIVSEGYGKSPDWSNALYHNTVINGDIQFLDDLKSHISLEESLFCNVVERYKREPMKSSQLQSNIKSILSLCSDMKLKYELASSLGFTEIMQELMKTEMVGSYLRDVIGSTS
ncbi:spatacsin-like [Tubulanus polymorphus]|uniref:spatacsin-like n=1 Tax=Tubulanus polymorphus TaxID=672921 RepID=UPI003DA48AEF